MVALERLSSRGGKVSPWGDGCPERDGSRIMARLLGLDIYIIRPQVGNGHGVRNSLLSGGDHEENRNSADRAGNAGGDRRRSARRRRRRVGRVERRFRLFLQRGWHPHRLLLRSR